MADKLLVLGATKMIGDLLQNNTNIAQLNYNAIIKICNYLGINTKIILSSELNKDNSLHAQDKVININKLLGSGIYINAIGGQELYNRKTFAQNGIELKFIKMNEIKYQQFKNDFVPNLSIIDVMMFNSVEKIKEMLNNYELI